MAYDMTPFGGWLISDYKYVSSNLCYPSIMAFERFNPFIAGIESDVDTFSLTG